MISEKAKQLAVKTLYEDACACVIVSNDGEMHRFFGRGVSDLFQILNSNATILKDAFIADKVVGKGAAALMILGGVNEVFTGMISVPAFELLNKSSIKVNFREKVDAIINRTGTGPCPVEALCKDCGTADQCLPLISNFLASLQDR